VEEIVRVLHSIKKEGLAVLLVEQNLRVALSLADRHYVMSKGQVCFTGTTDQLENNERVLSEYLSV
jgi:branched-chain amino acid transport system ATP-binding protein